MPKGTGWGQSAGKIRRIDGNPQRLDATDPASPLGYAAVMIKSDPCGDTGAQRN